MKFHFEGRIMVYTEKEARTKWCAMIQRVCVVSDCMMWRWQPLLADDSFKEAVKKAAVELDDKSPSRKKAVQHVIEHRSDYGLPDKPYKGFCGLAGEPLR